MPCCFTRTCRRPIDDDAGCGEERDPGTIRPDAIRQVPGRPGRLKVHPTRAGCQISGSFRTTHEGRHRPRPAPIRSNRSLPHPGPCCEKRQNDPSRRHGNASARPSITCHHTNVPVTSGTQGMRPSHHGTFWPPLPPSGMAGAVSQPGPIMAALRRPRPSWRSTIMFCSSR